ncbi:MAG: hypothetical protein K2M07_08745 [Muribaculaceae bacterium]|nr:hypothetical protein [Muribaculaceae bacterium]
MNTIDTSKKLWSKISEWSMRAGVASARPVMLLYFVMTDTTKPLRLRAAIARKLRRMFAADSIDVVPALVQGDSTFSISRKYITPEIEQRTDSILGRLTSFHSPFSFK